MRTIGEIVAVVGILLGLIFVGVEIRLNTRSTEVSAYQNLMQQISELNALAIENPDFAVLLNRETVWNRDFTTFTAREWEQINAYLWLLFRHGDMAFYQFERGLLTAERLRSAMSPMTARLGFNSVQREWEGRKANFSPEYQNYVDSIIAALP